jgi:2',3'-cyclic-nucleotide 2'-phosphodiesterase (5'-nucleotidase family)
MKSHRICALVLLALGAACASRPPAPLERAQIAVDARAIAPDPAIEAMLAPYAREVAPLRATIGRAAVAMTNARGDGRLGDWVAEVVRRAASEKLGREVPAAFVNAGGIRTALPQGEVSIFTFMEMLPFENVIVVFDLSGEQMLQLAARLAQRWAYFPLAGMTIEADAAGAVQSVKVAGQAVDPKARYSLATLDYLAGGGDNLDLLKTFPAPATTGVLIRQAAIDRVKALSAEGKPIEPPAKVAHYRKPDTAKGAPS